MKKIFFCLFGIFNFVVVYSQNVGIGTTTVPELLTVNGTALIDAGNLNNGFFPNGKVLKFGTVGGIGIGSNKGTGPTYNGLELFTNFSPRIIIDSAGLVGIHANPIPPFKLAVNGNSFMGGLAIGTTLPAFSSYKLDVEGNARVKNDFYTNGDLWVDQNFDVDGTSNFGGTINAAGNILVGGNITTTGNITVDGGRGIVRGPNAGQLVLAFSAGSISFTNAPAGHVQDVSFGIPANQFAANPRISIANLTNHSGTFERWTYSIVNVDFANNTFWVRFYNASSQPSTTAFTLNFILAGVAL